VQAYGDPAMRSYGDLDMLVRQRNIAGHGTDERCRYVRQSRSAPLTPAGFPGNIFLQAGFLNSSSSCTTTARCAIFPAAFLLRNFSRANPRARRWSRRLRPLCGRELVLICIHGAKHSGAINGIADVAALISRQTAINWERVAGFRESSRSGRMLHTGLRLLRLAESAITAKCKQRCKPIRQQLRSRHKLASGSPPRASVLRSLRTSLFPHAHGGNVIRASAYLCASPFSSTEKTGRVMRRATVTTILEVYAGLFAGRKYSRAGRS